MKAAADIATGELQGRVEGQQHADALAQQRLEQGVQLFQQGRQLEQEQRQQQSGIYERALALAPQVQPGQRGSYLTDVLAKLQGVQGAPSAYGLPQLQGLYQGYQRAVPSALPFSFPTPGAAPGTVPGPAPGNESAPTAPPSPPPGTPVPGGGPPAAVTGGGVPAPPATAGPPGAGPSGGFGPLAGPFLGGGGQLPPPPPPLSPGGQMGQMLNQQFGGVMGQLPLTPQDALHAFAGPQFQAAQQHRQAVTAHAAATSGASGTNPAGTAPPNRPPAESQIGAAGGQGATSPPPGPTAPPPPVPPSASLGVAPQTVGLPPGVLQGALGPGVPNQPPNELRIPGLSRGYAYGEIDPRTAQAAETRLATAYSRLINAHLSPEQRQYVMSRAAARPPQINTTQDLAAVTALTSELEALPAGLGSSIYSAEERAGRAGPEERNLVQQALAIIGKGGRRNPETGLVDPEYVRQVVSTIGGGKIAYLADVMASGDFGTGDVQKLLNKSVDKIFSPGFAKLDPATRRRYLDTAQGWADTLGEKIKLPADVYLEMTPVERERARQGWARIENSQNQELNAEARLQLSRETLFDRVHGLLGGAGGKGTRLTANVQLAAARKPYDEAFTNYRALRHLKNFEYDLTQYDTAKNNLLTGSPSLAAMDEGAAIQHIIQDPRTSQNARILANGDLRRYQAAERFQAAAEQLAEAGTTATGAGAAGVQFGGTGPVYGVQPTPPGGAPNHGVPGAGQGQPQAMIVTSPRGEKRRMVLDPVAMASSLLGQHPGWTPQQAQRKVQMMIQEAKAGRTR